ncbi:MAG: CvpA family protein [Alphaproteobacteria bacterium]
MIETHLNVFDIIVLAIVGFSCLFAFFRGLVREILSLVAWIGAAIVTMRYFPDALEFTKEHFKSEAMAVGAAVIGLYIASLFAFSIVNWMLIKVIKQGGEAGILDNMLGLGFGALRGAFIVSLGFFMLTMVMPEDEDDMPKWLKESVTRPYVAKGSAILVNAAPEYLKDVSKLQERAKTYAEENAKSAEDTESDAEQEFENMMRKSQPAR